MSEDNEAEIQMAFVRVCRNCNTARQVWFQMRKLFPEFTMEQIRDVVQPILKNMVEATRD